MQSKAARLEHSFVTNDERPHVTHLFIEADGHSHIDTGHAYNDADIFSSVGDLEIFKERPDFSILVAFSSGHFRSRGERGKTSQKSKCPTDIKCERSLAEKVFSRGQNIDNNGCLFFSKIHNHV